MEIGSNTAEIFFQAENVQKHEWNVLQTKKAQNHEFDFLQIKKAQKQESNLEAKKK